MAIFDRDVADDLHESYNDPNCKCNPHAVHCRGIEEHPDHRAERGVVAVAGERETSVNLGRERHNSEKKEGHSKAIIDDLQRTEKFCFLDSLLHKILLFQDKKPFLLRNRSVDFYQFCCIIFYVKYYNTHSLLFQYQISTILS